MLCLVFPRDIIYEYYSWWNFTSILLYSSILSSFLWLKRQVILGLTQKVFWANFRYFEIKKVNLNSLPRMVDTNRCFYFDFKFCAEYFLYILCRIAFDFNYKWGTFFETHCMCIGYIVYQFRIMLLFICVFYRIVFYQSIPPYWKKIFKRILQKLKLTKETKEINSGHLFLKDSFLRLYDL